MLDSNKSRSVPVVLITLIFLSFFTFSIPPVLALVLEQDLAEQYRDQGYELQQQGDLNGALAFYSKAITLGGSSNPVLLNDVGIIYEQLGMVGKAEEHYLQAVEHNEGYLPAYSNLAYLYANQGQKEKALAYFQRRYELSEPGDPWGEKAKEEMIRLSPDLAKQFRQEQIYTFANQVQQQKQQEFMDQLNRSTQYFERGLHYQANGELEKALAEFNRALAMTPDNPKFQKAKQQIIRELAAQRIRQQSELAIQKLSAGDTYSAKREIQNILSTIPNEPILNSR